MKQATSLLVPVCVLLILGSCGPALHRDIPKAEAHYQRKKLVTHGEEELPAAHTARVLVREATPEAVTKAEGGSPGPEISSVPSAGATQQVIVDVETASIQRTVDLPQEDSLTGDEEPEEIDEAVLDEAMESERIARSAYRFSFLPAFSLIFFPLLLIGVIGTLTQLSRFRRYEYVTEAGLDYEERAKRTLILSIVVPIAAVLLLILVALVLL